MDRLGGKFLSLSMAGGDNNGLVMRARQIIHGLLKKIELNNARLRFIYFLSANP